MSYELRVRFLQILLILNIFFLSDKSIAENNLNFHEIDIDIDITAHRLTATDRLTIKSYHADSISLLLNESVKIAELRLNGNITKFEGRTKENPLYKKVYEVDIKVPDDIKKNGSFILEIKYTTAFDKKPGIL